REDGGEQPEHRASPHERLHVLDRRDRTDVRASSLRRAGDRERRDHADRVERDGADQQPQPQTGRPDLQQLGADEPDHGPSPAGRAGGSGGTSPVSARNASSSEDVSPRSSCRTRPSAAATSPTRSGERFRIESEPFGSSATTAPARSSAVRNAAAEGERAITCAPAAAVSSAT